MNRALPLRLRCFLREVALRVIPSMREPRESRRARPEEARHELPHFAYRICLLGTRPGRMSFDDRGTQTLLYATEAASREIAEMRMLAKFAATSLVPQPGFLKLDVQGYELEVLSGRTRMLGGVQAMLAEARFYRFHSAMPAADELIHFMVRRGFSFYDIMERVRQKEDDALGHLDLMFVRSEHPLRWKRSW